MKMRDIATRSFAALALLVHVTTIAALCACASPSMVTPVAVAMTTANTNEHDSGMKMAGTSMGLCHETGTPGVQISSLRDCCCDHTRATTMSTTTVTIETSFLLTSASGELAPGRAPSSIDTVASPLHRARVPPPRPTLRV